MKVLFSITFALLLISCTKKPSPNGTYLTFDIKPNETRFYGVDATENDTISTFLKGKLTGRKYQITFKKDYTILKDLEEKEETVLAKNYSHVNGTYYSTSIPKGKETFKLQLFPDTVSLSSAILVFDLYTPKKQFIIPAQVGVHSNLQYGRAVCYLSKLEEQ
jgi:hypothetical protein